MPLRHPLLLLLLAASPWGLDAAEPAASDPTDLLDPSAEVAKAPPPEAEAVKRAQAAIRELYAADYATPKARAALIPTLIDQALQAQDDPATRFAMLNEARELAIQGKDVAAVIALCEQIAKGWQGQGAVAQQRLCLPRITGVAVVPSLLKLLDAPTDVNANGTVGRWYAVEVQDWERALPLLALGGDAAMAKAASAELQAPDQPSAVSALGDAWYDIGKRTATAREPFWRHALALYERAKPRLTGLNLALADKRIAEIEAILPLGPDIDYAHLSAGQWERLKGRIISVDAARGVNPTPIVLADGQRVRVVPHPTETWKISDPSGVDQQTTWKGGMQGRRAVGSLQCVVGKGLEQAPGIISGVGPLSLFPLVPAAGPRRRVMITGTIRVKVIPVTD